MERGQIAVMGKEPGTFRQVFEKKKFAVVKRHEGEVAVRFLKVTGSRGLKGRGRQLPEPSTERRPRRRLGHISISNAARMRTQGSVEILGLAARKGWPKGGGGLLLGKNTGVCITT